MRYLSDNLATVVGLVLVWRGIWYVLDAIDLSFFGQADHVLTALGGIALGLAILYLPDHDLKEIQQL